MDRILVSDDEPNFVRSLARIGRRRGIEVLADTSGDVVARARELKPSLIVLDIMQPGDGLELLQRLKDDPLTESIDVITISAVDHSFYMTRSLEIGALTFLTKPLAMNFMQSLASFVRSRRTLH